MQFDILTLFPAIFKGFFEESLIKKALERGLISIDIHDIRSETSDKHKTADDVSFGGGPGMLLSVEPIYRALTSIEGYQNATKILLTPQGQTYSQEQAKNLSKKDHLILICGHYEGFDERVRSLVDLEISIGDYVLTGGEIGAMVIVDSVSRLLPGVLSSNESFEQDSFYDGMLEYPQYTRPQEFMGMKVPDVLISGNHQDVDKWRKTESLKRTQERRPDLLKKAEKKD